MNWRNTVLAVVGAWFTISAWLLNPMHSGAYVATAIILGVLILVVGVWGLSIPAGMTWRYYLAALMGLYMGLTPLFYNFTRFAAALWITMLVGLVTVVDGLWQVFSVRHHTNEPEHDGRHHVA